MRNPRRWLDVEQIEERSLPSAPGLAPGLIAEQRAILAVGDNAAASIDLREFRADGGRPDWFVEDAERPARDSPDHFRHEADFRAMRGEDGDEVTPGRPAPASEPSASATPAPPRPQIGRPSEGARLVLPPTPNVTSPAVSPAAVDHPGPVAGSTGDVIGRPQVSFLGGPRTDPPGSDESTTAPPPGCPADPPEEPTTTGDLVRSVAVAVGPVAGMVPFDVNTLSAGAGRLLTAVSDLGSAGVDELSAWDSTVWVGTAVLLAGGAVRVARTRSAPRPPGDPRAQQALPGGM